MPQVLRAGAEPVQGAGPRRGINARSQLIVSSAWGPTPKTINVLQGKKNRRHMYLPVGVEALGHALEAARGVRGDGVPRLGPAAVEVVDAVVYGWMDGGRGREA